MYITKEFVQAHVICPRLAYTRLHEPAAPEFLTPEALDRMAEGASVGRAARDEFPNGVTVSGGTWERRLAVTEKLVNAGTPVIFEAAFEAPGELRAVVDVLRVDGRGLDVTEVKSGTVLKKEHLYDVAFQMLVLETLGYHVGGASLLHPNPAFRAGSTSAPLFVSEDVQADIADILPELPEHVDAVRTLATDPRTPQSPFRTSCKSCPLRARCEPADPDHIRTLYHIREQEATKFEQQGIIAIRQIPPHWKTSSKVRSRQVDLARSGNEVFLDRDQLRSDLTPLRGLTIGHIDFETIQSAIPMYQGTAPWQQIPVQWSCHLEVGDRISHAEWLAHGPGDPREEFATTLLDTVRNTDILTVWNEKFEKAVLAHLAEHLPHHRTELVNASEKIIDLLKVVRASVYHPAFHGSFSLKKVLPALVPDLSYRGMVVQNGAVAAVELKRLLRGAIPREAVNELRRDLLAYCALDTYAEVALLRHLFQESGL